MGRKSVRRERRRQIAEALATVFAERGFAQSTMVAVAERAGVSPGLIHHHFRDKDDLLDELLTLLLHRLGERLRPEGAAPPSLAQVVEATLSLNADSDPVTARCWVGLLAEATRNEALRQRIERHIASWLTGLQALDDGRLDLSQASAVLAFITGALVFGLFAPEAARGFAAPALKQLLASMPSAAPKTR